MDNICKIHNEPAQYCEQDTEQKLMMLCRFCVQTKLNNSKKDGNNIYIIKVLEQLESSFNLKISDLQEFVLIIQQYAQQVSQQLMKIKVQVDQNIQNIIQVRNQVKNKNGDFAILEINQINENVEIMNKQLKSSMEQLKNQLQDLEVNLKQDQLLQSLNTLKDEIKITQEQSVIENRIAIDQKFDYQLIKQSSCKINGYCSAIAFNSDSTIMIAGCNSLIKIFEFKEEKLREIQQLNSHQSDVNCLLFMKKTNQFISAGADKTIIVWQQNQNKQWLSSQAFKGHTSFIYCIIINQNETMLISGSHDKTIKFWHKQNNIWGSNQSINCYNYVYSISLNDNEDQLIACVNEKQILVIQLQVQEWAIIQNISIEQHGFRLCFINQDQFIFQPFQEKHLLVFNYDSNDQAFQKEQEVQYQNQAQDLNVLFPIRYISQNGLIMVKNDHHVHLIKRTDNGAFKVEQSINFGTYDLNGSITDDGRYIATWDSKSKEIQIRKLQY